jgi:hypothetical protein
VGVYNGSARLPASLILALSGTRALQTLRRATAPAAAAVSLGPECRLRLFLIADLEGLEPLRFTSGECWQAR